MCIYAAIADNDKPNEMLEKKKEYSRDPRLNVKNQDVNVHCKKNKIKYVWGK